MGLRDPRSDVRGGLQIPPLHLGGGLGVQYSPFSEVQFLRLFVFLPLVSRHCQRYAL